MRTNEVGIQPPQALLVQLLVILAQWGFGVWLLPVLHMVHSTVPLRWTAFIVCIAVFLLSKKWMVKFFAKHNANSEHFVGGGTELMVWVGAAVPTGEMRC
jgi:hypothetical protein